MLGKFSSKQPRLTFESLEIRTQLSSIHAVEALGQANDHRPAIVGHGLGSANQNSVTNLHATLSDPAGTSGVTGTAHYQTRTHKGVTTTAFRVNVAGATEGDVIDVSVDGTAVGQITAGADGTGSLRLSTDVPTAAAGSVITLSQTTTDEAGEPVLTVLATGMLVGRGKAAHQSLHLLANATDETSGVKVRSVFQMETQGTHSENNFVVQIRGATAGDVLDISITDSAGASQSLGEVTVGPAGNARFHGHNLSMSPAAGSTLTVSSVNDDETLTTLVSATFAVKKQK